MRAKPNLLDVKSIVSRIARIIRTHRTFAIILVTALLIIAFAVKSTYSVGSCQKQASIKIIDESDGKTLTARSINTSEDSLFNNYVTTISKHFFFKIDELGQCNGNVKTDPQVELVFVYRPLISYGIAPFNFELKRTNNTRYLDSPWVKLAITSSPKLFVRVAFIWNERQFLLDQAVLSGARASPNVPLLPIDRDILSQFEQDYIGIERNSLSKEAKAAAQANLTGLPPDTIWLFRQAPSLDWAGLLTEQALEKTITQGTEKNIELTKALLNRRFASRQKEQRYHSVLDLQDMFDIDKYRIKSLY
jgi:hypothetical protein